MAGKKERFRVGSYLPGLQMTDPTFTRFARKAGITLKRVPGWPKTGPQADKLREIVKHEMGARG
ncbi:hypothetical protein ACSMXM_05735 [Pacificimonas sp. ICDLI1SI03]